MKVQQSNKSEDLTVYKDEILRNIEEIWGFTIHWGFIMFYSDWNPDQKDQRTNLRSKDWIPNQCTM